MLTNYANTLKRKVTRAHKDGASSKQGVLVLCSKVSNGEQLVKTAQVVKRMDNLRFSRGNGSSRTDLKEYDSNVQSSPASVTMTTPGNGVCGCAFGAAAGN